MRPLARSLAWQGVSAALTFALLLSLGFWQLRRLEWKEALIARIETRARAEPVVLPKRTEWVGLRDEDYDYRHVTAGGLFDLAKSALVFSQAPAGASGQEPGFFVLTPLRLGQDGVMLVNRGFVAQSKAAGGAWRNEPVGWVTITGWLRPPQKRNAFTPADDPKKSQWYTADPVKIAGALGLAEAAPFVLQQEAKADGDGLFREAPDVADIANNHLSYAVTWFGLAAALAVICVFYAKSRMESVKSA